MEPQFFQSHPMDHPIQTPIVTHEGMWRIDFNSDPHWSKYRVVM
jgi:hypothetical protein